MRNGQAIDASVFHLTERCQKPRADLTSLSGLEWN